MEFIFIMNSKTLNHCKNTAQIVFLKCSQKIVTLVEKSIFCSLDRKKFKNQIIMKTFILLLSIGFSFHLFAQKVDSVGFLSNLKGNGVCLRKGNEEKLKIPFYFINGDKIKMISGNAILVLFTEEEVKLASGESYTFAFNDMAKVNSKDLLMFKNTKQSNSSFKMRAIGETKNYAFPRDSKILDPAKAIIQISTNALKKTKYSFILKEKETNRRVYELLNTDSSCIDLRLAPLKPGNKYSWKIKLAESEFFGEFDVMTEEQANQIEKFELNSRASYVTAFNYYCSESCFFEAYHVIDNAITVYSDDEYFVYLKNSLFQ